MDLELVVAIAGICLFIIFYNTVDCYTKFKRRIKEGKILTYFPSWAGTKKPLIWFAFWSIIEFLNLFLFVGVAVLIRSPKNLLVAFLLAVPVYIGLYEISYRIAIYLKKRLISKKCK